MAKEVKITINTKNPTISVGTKANVVVGRDSSLDPAIHFKSTGSSGNKGDSGSVGPAGVDGIDGVGLTTVQENQIGVNSLKITYPEDDASKLAGISAGAEVNVRSDWNSISGDSEILNKPFVPLDLTVSGQGIVHANNYTDTDTVYTHPSNHSISVITGLQSALNGKINNAQVLTDVPSGALFTDTDTVYSHPDNHAISVTTGLQSALDGKVDDGQVLTDVPSGALFTDTNTVYDATTIQAEVDANTTKNTNVVGDLTVTAAGHKLQLNTSNGADVSLPLATTDAWGVMSDEMFDEHEINKAKVSNIVQANVTGNAGTVTTNADLTGDVTSSGNATTMAAAQTNINSILATDLVIGEDLQTCIDFGTPNNIKLKLNNTDEITIAGNSMYPTSNNGIALGVSNNGWSDLFLASGAALSWSGGAYVYSFSNELHVGLNTSGSDVKIHGDTSGAHLFWDESADNLSAQGSATITATTVTTSTHFIHTGTYLSYSYSRYLPLNGSLNEQNTSTSGPEYTSFVWPYGGTVKSIWVRTEADSGDTVIKLYKGANGSSVSTAMGSVTLDCDANTSVEFDMTGVTNNFNQGEAMAIWIDPTNASQGVNVTIECVFNLTT